VTEMMRVNPVVKCCVSAISNRHF